MEGESIFSNDLDEFITDDGVENKKKQEIQYSEWGVGGGDLPSKYIRYWIKTSSNIRRL